MDSSGHVHIRMFLSAAGLGLFFLSSSNLKMLAGLRSPALYLFLLILLFEVIRAVLPPGVASRFSLPEGALRLYRLAPAIWALYVAGFAGAYVFFNRKSAAFSLMVLNAVVCFLLSLNSLVPLARTGEPFYSSGGQSYYLYPLLYVGDWTGKYVLAPFAHANRIGDILSIGFFSGLGILCYFLLQWRERREKENFYERKITRREWELFAFFGLFTLVTGLVILLLFSRGTIVCAGGIFILSFFSLAFKFPSKTQWALFLGVLTAFILFFLWAGNLKGAWKEVRTLEAESRAADTDLNKAEYASRSIFMNQEGARRALKMHEDYPIWGVGTRGYALLSQEYASEGLYKKLKNPDTAAWSHYLQVLAEEGFGAYLYFLFLAAYILEWGRGMLRTKSHFKFISSLSFAAPVFVVFTHASIIETMERFTVAMPVYMLMGASLAVLRKNFEHVG